MNQHARRSTACDQGVVWLLLIMALGTFVPSVLWPEWRALNTLQAACQTRRDGLKTFERKVEQGRRALDAMQTDPLVIARLAQRELRFRRPGQRWVSLAGVIDRPSNKVLSHPQVNPSLFDYGSVFCDEPSRRILIVMSVGLIGIALWLGGRVDSMSTRLT